MKIALHSPDFLPWAGFWAKYIESDKFVLTTGIKYQPTGYFNRVWAENRQLVVPVTSDGDGVQLKNMRYRGQDLKSITAVVRSTFVTHPRAVYGHRVEPIADLLQQHCLEESGSLCDLNIRLIQLIVLAMKLPPKLVVDPRKYFGGTTAYKVFEIVARHAPGGTYLSGYNAGNFDVPKEFQHRFSMLRQEERNLYAPGTILQLIARERDPVDILQSSFAWREAA